MLGSEKIVAFAATTDRSRAMDFYGGRLGLRLVSDEPHALVYDANGTMLRVQMVREVLGGQYTMLGWQVADIAATARRLKDKGVELMRVEGLSQDELGIWNTPAGAKVAWFKDPDGNILSLTQFS